MQLVAEVRGALRSYVRHHPSAMHPGQTPKNLIGRINVVPLDAIVAVAHSSKYYSTLLSLRRCIYIKIMNFCIRVHTCKWIKGSSDANPGGIPLNISSSEA